jgi:hypothetical protein
LVLDVVQPVDEFDRLRGGVPRVEELAAGV